MRLSIAPSTCSRLSLVSGHSLRCINDAVSCVGVRRCIKMAIVHDLAESLVGDITPYDGQCLKELALA